MKVDVWVISDRDFSERVDRQEEIHENAADIAMLYHYDECTRGENWGGILQEWHMRWDSYDLDDEGTIHWSAGRRFTPWTPEDCDDIELWLDFEEELVVPDTAWVDYPSHIEPASSLVHHHRQTRGEDIYWPSAIVSREGQALLSAYRHWGLDTTDLTFGESAAVAMLETYAGRAVVSMVWDQ